MIRERVIQERVIPERVIRERVIQKRVLRKRGRHRRGCDTGEGVIPEGRLWYKLARTKLGHQERWRTKEV